MKFKVINVDAAAAGHVVKLQGMGSTKEPDNDPEFFNHPHQSQIVLVLKPETAAKYQPGKVYELNLK